MNFFRSKSKYGAKKVDHAGMSFASKLEAAVFDLLSTRKLGGEIEKIQAQDSIYLTDAEILFKPDFKCTRPDGSDFWVEAKGYPTPVWAIKKRLWKVYGPGDLEIWEGSHARPKLTEIIKPKERRKT